MTTKREPKMHYVATRFDERLEESRTVPYVELTEAEIDAVTLTIDTEEPTLNVAPLLKVVTSIVAAREAAARREALLEVRRSVAVVRTPLNNLVGLSRAQAFHVGVGEVATLLDNTLLAEPERDEEGS